MYAGPIACRQYYRGIRKDELLELQELLTCSMTGL